MKSRNVSLLAGVSYLIIFFAAIFANFFVLESILQAPVETMQQNSLTVRFGIVAFLVTVLFDVVIAWALFELFKNHPLTRLSSYFRLMHAAIMGVAIFALPLALSKNTAEEILYQAEIFNTIWLIGLFFFGMHLILLSKITKRPFVISIFLMIAGAMYMIDTLTHFLLEDYASYAKIMLTLVAIPSILGEMAFAIWLLAKGGKNETLSAD